MVVDKIEHASLYYGLGERHLCVEVHKARYEL